MAICIQTLGFETFFVDLLSRLGIPLTEGTKYWLQQTDARREKKKAKAKLLVTKRKRRQDYYEKLRLKTVQAREDSKKGTAYKTGSGALADLEEPKKKKQRSNSTAPRRACLCGSVSHQRTNHSQCPLNKIYRNAPKEMIKELEQDRENQAFIDTLDLSQNDIAKEIMRSEEDIEQNNTD